MLKKSSKKLLTMGILLTVLMLSLTGCGSDEQFISGTYISDNEETMLVCDKEIIFIVQGDDIGASGYQIDGDVLVLGNSAYTFDGEDKSSLKIGSEVYTKTSCPLSVRWKLVKWSSKSRIESASLGVIQWMILDPIFMEGNNSVGHYSMVGSWMALVGLLIVIGIVYIIVANIKGRKKK